MRFCLIYVVLHVVAGVFAIPALIITLIIETIIVTRKDKELAQELKPVDTNSDEYLAKFMPKN